MSGKTPQDEGHRQYRPGTIRGARAAPPRLSAAECPIEAIHGEHFHQRQLCLDMEALATTRVPRAALALRVLVNLCRDLPAHLADEEDGLFPRLRLRARPEDELDKTLTGLSREHETLRAAIAALVPALASMADGSLPAADTGAALQGLAATERRHLIVENAILLPLARLRLTAQDKRALMAEICARRKAPPAIGPVCARALDRLAPQAGPSLLGDWPCPCTN